MNIALANKFYYRRGGDCVYTLGLQELLAAHGHAVSVFAMQHPQNLPCPEWEQYFPPQVEFRLGPGLLEAVRRPLGTRQVRQLWQRFLEAAQPQVVHAGNIHSQLSPLLLEEAHSRGIRTVWTLHDYKLLCPRYDSQRPGYGPCIACWATDHQGRRPSKTACLRHRCVKASLVASAIGMLEAMKWHRRRLEQATDIFLCPSRFMAERMVQGGFAREKLRVLCNFIDTAKCDTARLAKPALDYYLYCGRLSAEKGVLTLVKAAIQTPELPLVIAGDGPERAKAEAHAAGHPHIRFVGHQEWPQLKPLVAGARFAVVPSEWWENNPLSVIEAQCLGTPVLGAEIGGIPELTSLGGATFPSGDVHALATALRLMWHTPTDRQALAARAREAYGAERYYRQLIDIYNGKN